MDPIGIRKIHQNTSQCTVYCDVFCVFQWAPITILPLAYAPCLKDTAESTDTTPIGRRAEATSPTATSSGRYNVLRRIVSGQEIRTPSARERERERIGENRGVEPSVQTRVGTKKKHRTSLAGSFSYASCA